MADKPFHTLKAEEIAKVFGDTHALGGVSLEIASGKVHGLVGHNGAGKSTLLRVLSGSIRPDSGIIVKDGDPIDFHSPVDAIRAGVSTVYQELSLLPNLTIAENTFLGSEPVRCGFLKRNEMIKSTRQLLERFDLSLSPQAKIRELSISQRQLVEIVIAVHRNADFLLLDEPTSSLEANSIEKMLQWLDTLSKRENVGVLFISHKIEELLSVCSTITVLADGVVQLHRDRADFDRSEIVSAVIGSQRESTNGGIVISSMKPSGKGAADSQTSGIALKVRNLQTKRLSDVSLEVQRNKVVGLYGLVGSGRSRFLRSLIGMERITNGHIELFGDGYIPRNPKHSLLSGIVFVTEDRKIDGFVPQMSAKQNTLLPVLDDFSRLGWLGLKEMDREATALLNNLSVIGDIDRPMNRLSGGNQQKVLFAKAIRQRPRLLLLDEPTKGVDIGAKVAIQKLIRYLAGQQNITVIMVSSEEEEILRVADDVAIFRNGFCDGTLYASRDLDEGKLRALAWHDDAKRLPA